MWVGIYYNKIIIHCGYGNERCNTYSRVMCHLTAAVNYCFGGIS